MGIYSETDPISVLPGVGEKTSERLSSLGIDSLGDLLMDLPVRYQFFPEIKDVSELTVGETAAVRVRLPYGGKRVGGRRLGMVRAQGGDATGRIDIFFFHMPYLASTFRRGSTFVFLGRVTQRGSVPEMTQPAFYAPEEYALRCGSLQPVYRSEKGLSSPRIAKLIALAMAGTDIHEILPQEIRSRYDLMPRSQALRILHDPQSDAELAAARRTMVFTEFFTFLYLVRLRRDKTGRHTAGISIRAGEQCSRLIDALPYQLTGAQQRVWAEIKGDLASGSQMNRLIQGDVGSGKTIVALLAMLAACESGAQAAMMAPTDILARQHYATITEALSRAGLPQRVVLLTGSLTAKERRAALEDIRMHRADIAVGTHALIQGGVEFDQLGLVITDEQHRFGVSQREGFTEKGMTPHILVMSATPIPRTLAMILYADMDISLLDEMPADRIPIKTALVDPSSRKKSWKFILDEIRKGNQAYMICPMVEESEEISAENVEDYFEDVREFFPEEIRGALLHGQMKGREKDEIMNRFTARELDYLVATTVVEVGVDAPGATVILIENAERFGLAQLHQLRGRVGRSGLQSYCILINASDQPAVKERLEVLLRAKDGFELAEEDLRIRGPGDMLGVRQSGQMSFRIGDVYSDSGVLIKAAEAADEVSSGRVFLSDEERAVLARISARESAGFSL